MRNKRNQLNAKRSRYGRYEEMECQIQSRTKNTPLVKEFNGWASKELIELIAYIGEETKDPLSWLEVKNLLLKYIAENKLEHPSKRNQILCDQRLYKIFGKNILRRSEMYKLIESHIMPKRGDLKHEPPVNPDDLEGNKEPIDITMIVKRHGVPKNANEDKVQRAKPNDFAAINVHNIRLIYLKRDVLEDLLEDLGSFTENVTGSFVRIRVTGTGDYQRMWSHRLVQVVGIKKIQEAYITGRKRTDLILEILNLGKEEDIFINEVSNQDFTEEECQQLHQSVKCGLIKQPSLGELQKIAKALHKVKVNNWLETEIMKLSNLRDRASEKGYRKELRECVEKIQVISSPEERARMLQELPEVIAGPCLEQDSDIEILEEKPADWSQGNSKTRPKHSRNITNEKKGNDSGWSHFNWESDQNNERDPNDVSRSWEKKENKEEHPSYAEKTQNCSQRIATRCDTISTTREMKVGRMTGWSQGFVKSTAFPSSSRWLQARTHMQKSPSLMAHISKSNPPFSKGGDSEAEKVWRYQDRAGMVRGPFSMFQLRKWEKTGLLPLDLRIWKIFQQQDDSVLLTDALSGRFYHPGPERDSKSNHTCLLKKTGINVSPSGLEQRRNMMPSLKCSETNDLSPKFNAKVGTSSNDSLEPSNNTTESITESDDWPL